MKDKEALIREFIGDGVCLIVEPSASFSVNLQGCFIQMGMPLSQVMTSKSLEEAKRIIEEKKPKLLVTEYDLPPGLGLTLIELQEAQYEDSKRVGIVVTKNSTDSAVAEAAEGAVDAFILKPFSTDTFTQKLTDILYRKKNPTPYHHKMRAGRKKMSEKDLVGALSEFEEAKKLDPKPTLACFYMGEIYRLQKNVVKSVEQYQEGRTYQPLHYKCLIGEFEGLVAQEKFADAYSLVPTIRDNYPITSQRLGQIFMAAVYTLHFDDLNIYYDLFLKTENRTPWLIKLSSLALFTAGKYWIQKRDFDKALSYFEMGMTVKAREMDFLEKVVNEFLKVNAIPQAEKILARALPSDIGGAKHTQLKFRVDQVNLPTPKLIEQGRKIIADGNGTPEIYRILIQLLIQSGKETMAESFIIKAASEYPDMKSSLYEMLKAKNA